MDKIHGKLSSFVCRSQILRSKRLYYVVYKHEDEFPHRLLGRRSHVIHLFEVLLVLKDLDCENYPRLRENTLFHRRIPALD